VSHKIIANSDKEVMLKTPLDFINDSGYPLQTYLKEKITDTQNKHNWKMLVREHRWINSETKDEGFIDLILENNYTIFKLVVECKRITGSWTFLLPKTNVNTIERARLLYVDYNPLKYTWEEFSFLPGSFEAEYCVLETGGKKDNRTLEKIVGELLLSLEYFALQDSQIIWTKNLKERDKAPDKILPNKQTFYLPIIVTTATLKSLIYDPLKVDEKNGRIDQSDYSECQIDQIRLRKNLATNIDYAKPFPNDMLDLNHEHDRTVFIVSAEKFIDFLCNLKVHH